MNIKRLMTVLLLAAAPLVGCNDDDGGGPCDRCTNDSDCRSDLFCQQFTTPTTGNTFLACGDNNPNMTCPGQ